MSYKLTSEMVSVEDHLILKRKAEELEDRAELAELRVHALEKALITGIANGLVVDSEKLDICYEVNDDAVDYFLEEMGRV